MWALVFQGVASVAAKFLIWWAEREAIKNAERSKIALEGANRVIEALKWKAEHPISLGTDPGADFRVRGDPDPDPKARHSRPPDP